MSIKLKQRKRRATKARAKIKQRGAHRLCVHRSNTNIYVQLISPCGTKVLTSASTVDKGVRGNIKNGGNVEAAAVVGKMIAERALKTGIKQVAFDRSGYKFHGRVKALAEAAREAGLEF